MEEIIAKCGNRCDLCPLYKGNFSAMEAEKVNAMLYKYHQGSQGPPPRYSRGCDGCLAEGYRPRQDCKIRECGIAKRLSTCADCPDLFCGLLEADMAVVEGSLARHGAGMPPEDFGRYFRPFMIREMLTALRRRKDRAT